MKPAVTTHRKIVTVSLGVYGALAAVGLGWALLRGDRSLLWHPDPWFDLGEALGRGTAHGISLGLGLGLAAITIGLTRYWVTRFEWARAMHVTFQELLRGIDPGSVWLLALSSGVGEELFFRVGMQPTLGWLLTSLIFGAIHLGPGRKLGAWTLWALVMGLLFGSIYELTGSPLGPLVAHVLINGVNLLFISKYDARGPLPGRS